METEQEPRRILEGGDEASPELRALFESAGADTAPAARLARVETAVMTSVGVPAGMGLWSGLSSSKVVIVSSVLVVLGATVAVVEMRAGSVDPSEQPSVIALHRPVRTVEHGSPGPATLPAVTQAVQPQAVPAAPAPVERAQPTHAPRSHAPVSVHTRSTTTQSAGTAPTTAIAATATVPTATEHAPQAMSMPSPDEVALVASGRRALRAADYARALELLAEHARMYPHGMLSEESESLRIEALWRSGDQTGARTLRDAFHRAFPGSAYRARVDALVHD